MDANSADLQFQSQFEEIVEIVKRNHELLQELMDSLREAEAMSSINCSHIRNMILQAGTFATKAMFELEELKMERETAQMKHQMNKEVFALVNNMKRDVRRKLKEVSDMTKKTTEDEEKK
eukprot:TRINITY_DN776229_c0_g1_i1.p1 TRINITY_DN776229_c0_g1~~TRINITY_DN776229_c0_g1_i1.p1  ORF type:complete len:120 (-),score=23.67 TRINITY_DN776229_c0_g1_i1:140-499(-)